jgi:choline kinase
MNQFKPVNTTVVICCAGMGTRLGIGTTKALVDIDGTPLIIRQLDLLRDFDDIRIVVGFQAERIIDTVKTYRKDIMFAFNYQYETTGVADSLKKGLLGARENILSLDGDILINPRDFEKFISESDECLAITPILSAEPVMATVEGQMVIHLSKTEGNMQWPGIVKVSRKKLTGDSSHVYDILNHILPLKACIVRAREIDTQDDYENALEWFEGGQVD